MMNLILTGVTIIGIIIFLVVMYYKSKNEKFEFIEDEVMTMERLLDVVKAKILEFTEADSFSGMGAEEFRASYKRQERINKALVNCVHGIDEDKAIVMDLMSTILQQALPTEDYIAKVIEFNGNFLDVMTQFEIIMYFYKKEFGKDAFTEWLVKYNLHEEKYETEKKLEPTYLVTEEEVRYAYSQEKFELDYVDQINILTVILFQKYKGFGCIDTLREMNIDGLNFGTSGHILTKGPTHQSVTRSVWVYFRGTFIHLRFLNFGTESEMARIVSGLIRYNNPGPITIKDPHKISAMYDKSRVNAMRPPAAECWAAFIRKFTLSSNTLEGLIHNNKKLEDRYISNAHIPEMLIMFLMRGEVTVGFTGRQGSGKTTMMKAAVEYMDPKYTIRVLEMAFELYLRELYPDRNILTAQETPYISATEIQDGLKKADAAISIAGEVATDSVAVNMLQFAQVASIFTIFSHHANEARDLVKALANSIVAVRESMPVSIAQQQVVEVVRVNVHLNFTTDGRRYIERITEIIPEETGKAYPRYSKKDPVNTMNNITKEYYERTTDREPFRTRDIMRYNTITNTYELHNWFTPELTKHMFERLPISKKDSFSEFIKKEWGVD